MGSSWAEEKFELLPFASVFLQPAGSALPSLQQLVVDPEPAAALPQPGEVLEESFAQLPCPVIYPWRAQHVPCCREAC